ncbi:MAG TPA: DNA-3-methyladenine glycosylase [Chloroflexia bacterium]|nr:DNA-3-methyladenine glycosylase [Chloroflexia bacterium]
MPETGDERRTTADSSNPQPPTPNPFLGAAAHLRAADPVLAGLITAHGACTLTPEPDLFAALADSIISQQISVKAADAILRRFRALLPTGALDPAAILALPEASIRAAGLSGAKVVYIRDLAAHVVDGRLDLGALATAPDDAVITALTAVKGIGRWTAEMFLIFALGRLDVLPVGDLGLRRAVQRRYALPDLPTPAFLITLATPWRPYRSVATWYLWRSLAEGPVIGDR